MDDRLQVELLGGQYGEPVAHAETALVTENAHRSRAGTILFSHPLIEHAL